MTIKIVNKAVNEQKPYLKIIIKENIMKATFFKNHIRHTD